MKKNLTLLLLCSLIVLSACTFGTSRSPGSIAPITGTQGLVIDIIDNLPPRTLFVGDEFQVGIDIRNRGASDATGGVLEVSGLVEEYNIILEGKSRRLSRIEGKSVLNPEGGFLIETFTGLNKGLPEGAEEYKQPFVVNLEYDYETIASVDVCVNPSPLRYRFLNPQGCEVDSRISVPTSGAPIVVSRIEHVVTTQEGRPKNDFRIFIANRGNGKVVGPVDVRRVQLGGRSLICQPFEVDLEKKSGVGSSDDNVISCSAILAPEESAYVSTLSVELEYRYRVQEFGEFAVRSLFRP